MSEWIQLEKENNVKTNVHLNLSLCSNVWDMPRQMWSVVAVGIFEHIKNGPSTNQKWMYGIRIRSQRNYEKQLLASLCSSATPNRWIFVKIQIWGFYWHLFTYSSLGLKSDKNYTDFTCWPTNIYVLVLHNRPRQFCVRYELRPKIQVTANMSPCKRQAEKTG